MLQVAILLDWAAATTAQLSHLIHVIYWLLPPVRDRKERDGFSRSMLVTAEWNGPDVTIYDRARHALHCMLLYVYSNRSI